MEKLLGDQEDSGDVSGLVKLHLLAGEFIETLERDKRIVAARYIVQLSSNPKGPSDMGFLQFVQSKLNGGQKSA